MKSIFHSLIGLTTALGMVHSAAAQQTIGRVSPENARQASEVSIAINPVNIDNIVAGSLMRGYPDSTAPNFSFVSRDGGKTYSTSPVPNPDMRTQGDDILLFSGDGVCVHAFISFVGLWEAAPQRAASGIAIVRSDDGGGQWSEPVPVVDHINTTSPMEDKPWLVFDRQHRSPYYNHLYCSWTRFDVYGSTDPQDTTQIMFSRSTDAGKTFEPPQRVSDQPGSCVDDDDALEGATPSVGPEGTVYVVWAGPRGIEMDRSIDGGQSFGQDKLVIEMPGGWASSVDGISRHNGMPVTGVDHSQGKNRGTLYINWIDERNGDKDVFLIHSHDRGETWSAPLRVNDDPPQNGRDQFFTWMAIDPVDGSINIVFYDRRDTKGTGTRLTLARSLDGETFQNIPIEFPEFACHEEIFFGDYIGIDAQQGRVAVAFMHFEENLKLAISSAVLDFQPGTMERLPHGKRTEGQPETITVQHCLIGFEGSVPGFETKRSREDSEVLANQLLERARQGEDFDAIIREYTADQHPGIYQMANFNVLPNMNPEQEANKIYPRGMMVRAFGDIGFGLQVGEFGMTDYDPATSKYGWHIIQRIQ